MGNNELPNLDIGDLLPRHQAERSASTKKSAAFVAAIAISSTLFAAVSCAGGGEKDLQNPSIVITESDQQGNSESFEDQAVVRLPVDCVNLGRINAKLKSSVEWQGQNDDSLVQIQAATKSDKINDIKIKGNGKAKICFSGEEITGSSSEKAVIDMSKATVRYKFKNKNVISEIPDMSIDKEAIEDKIGDYVFFALNLGPPIREYNKAVKGSEEALGKQAKILLEKQIATSCDSEVWDPVKETVKYYLTQQYAEQGYSGSIEALFESTPQTEIKGIANDLTENPEFTFTEQVKKCNYEPFIQSE